MLLNFTNHPFNTWSDEQKQAALEKYTIVEDLPFPHINPNADELDIKSEARKYVELIISRKPMAVHLMGEMNFTFQLINYLMEEGIECIASTTKRMVIDQEDGTQKSTFNFVRFRSYNFLDEGKIKTEEIVLSEEQDKAFHLLADFVKETSEDQVFILKGYAGTGKTTLLKYFISDCIKNKKSVCLMASTGRAAAVLKNKAKYNATTVHSLVYKFDEIKATTEEAWQIKEDSKGQLFLFFSASVISKDSKKDIYIIDEASMVSAHDSEEINSVKFGTDNLLRDLFDSVGDAKVVFVGDPCQLPSVDISSISAALDKKFIEKNFHKKVVDFELVNIQRQAENSEILKIATPIRESIVNNQIPDFPTLKSS